MAGKKAKSEIDSIRGELTELTEAIYAMRDLVRVESAAAAAANGTGGRTSRGASVAAVSVTTDGADRLADRITDGIALQGAAHLGDNNSVSWSAHVAVDELADQDIDELARVLAAVGHRQRLVIVLAMLSGKSTAAELGSSLGLGTSGAVYHHLNVLVAAGLVRQTTRGVFAIAPERVGMLLSILASPLVSSVTTITSAGATEVVA